MAARLVSGGRLPAWVFPPGIASVSADDPALERPANRGMDVAGGAGPGGSGSLRPLADPTTFISHCLAAEPAAQARTSSRVGRSPSPPGHSAVAAGTGLRDRSGGRPDPADLGSSGCAFLPAPGSDRG